MVARHDVEGRTFGHMVVRLGCAPLDQVNECLRIQKRMRDMGVDEPLGEIMVKKGYLTTQHVSQVLRALGHQVHPIPGYQLLRKLGQGGMGTVYQAKQLSVDRIVAVKILSSLAVKDSSYVKRFFQEAQAAANLSHPNVVSVYDVGEASGTYYLVMEFIQGKTALDLMPVKQALPEKKVIELGLQVCEAIGYLHKRGFVHRDIKPENFLVARDGTLKLCDFGLAKSTESIDQSLTVTGMTVGTPYYMSPEQIRGERNIDIRADLYSLGASLYYLATGRHVFEGKTAAETMSLHLNEAPADPRRHRKEMSEGFGTILLRLLEKDPQKRYPDPVQVSDDLKRVQEGMPLIHAKPRPVPLRASRSTRRVSRMGVRPRKSNAVVPVAIGASAFLLVILVLLLLPTSSGDPVSGRPDGGNGARTGGPAPEERPAPKPDGNRTHGRPEDEDDAKKVAEAVRLLGEAEGHFKEERWSEAKRLLLRVQEEYAALRRVKDRMADIGAMLGTCDAKIKTLRDQVNRRHAEIAALRRTGDWKGVLVILEELKRRGVETGAVRMSEIDIQIEACRREITAVGLMESWAESWNEHRWGEVIGFARKLRTECGSTEVYRKEYAALEHSEKKADQELRAEAVLAEIRAGAAGKNWEKVSVFLSRMNREHYETETFKANSSELRDLQNRIYEADREKAEGEALLAWDKADLEYRQLCADRKYAEAIAVLEAFVRGYGLSKAYQEKFAKVIKDRIRSAQRSLDRHREKKAQDLAKEAGTCYAKKDYTNAYKRILEILKDYGDTKVAGQRSLKAMKTSCEEKLGYGEDVLLRIDLEKGAPAWEVIAGTANKPEAEYVEESYEGSQSVKMYYPSIEADSWAYLMYAIDGASLKEARSICFWARGTGPEVIGVRMVLRESTNEYHQSSVYQVGKEWKKVVIPLDDFSFLYGENTNRDLDREDVTSLGVIQGRKKDEIEFYVDLITAERK